MPATAVVRAPKIPITRLHLTGRAARRRGCAMSRNIGPSGARPAPGWNMSYFNSLSTATALSRPGRIGRCGKICRELGGAGGRGLERQRDAVHAVAKACRLRAVIEDVAEMAAATAAMHLGA